LKSVGSAWGRWEARLIAEAAQLNVSFAQARFDYRVAKRLDFQLYESKLAFRAQQIEHHKALVLQNAGEIRPQVSGEFLVAI
jgi:hypothetical protein